MPVTLKCRSWANHACTVEFLMDANRGQFYVIEVRPRIQVVHTVTDLITGVDTVKAQLRISEGGQINRALIERALQGGLSHHLGYPPGAARPADEGKHRNGRTTRLIWLALQTIIADRGRASKGGRAPMSEFATAYGDRFSRPAVTWTTDLPTVAGANQQRLAKASREWPAVIPASSTDWPTQVAVKMSHSAPDPTTSARPRESVSHVAKTAAKAPITLRPESTNGGCLPRPAHLAALG